MVSVNRDDCIHYVACPVCNKVYTSEEAAIIVGNKSARCSHVDFKEHAHRMHVEPTDRLMQKHFQSAACNLTVMLNVDWFQPYDQVKDSVGVMYLALMNLPCELLV